jgi:hypothetical protein
MDRETVSGAERRLAERYTVNLDGTAENLYRRSPDVAYHDESLRGQEHFRVSTVNVSTGGFMLAFDTEASTGDVMRLHFRLPATMNDVVYEVQVQWVKRNAVSLMGKYCAGVSFRIRNEDEIATLVEFARDHSPDPLP